MPVGGFTSIKTTANADSRNWDLHREFLGGNAESCLAKAEKLIKDFNGLSEYALFIKGIILRRQGKVVEALNEFQSATLLNPQNVANLKEVARCLYLLGRPRQSVEVFMSAEDIDSEDWEIHHNKALCYIQLKDYDEAAECFQTANSIARHECTYEQLGRLFVQTGQLQEALDVFLEAVEFSPDRSNLLTALGLVYLRLGDSFKAFLHLGNATAQDQTNPKTVLATASIIQDHQDLDAAMVKYRIAAAKAPDSPQVWNNVGMCFYSKGNYLAAISSLKKALSFAPFEWIIAYNLGLCHLKTEQYASAFHYLSATINLKPDFPPAFMHLAITLTHLDDHENAFMFYEKSLGLQEDFNTHLNYAIGLASAGENSRAREQLRLFEDGFGQLTGEQQGSNAESKTAADALKKKL